MSSWPHANPQMKALHMVEYIKCIWCLRGGFGDCESQGRLGQVTTKLPRDGGQARTVVHAWDFSHSREGSRRVVSSRPA